MDAEEVEFDTMLDAGLEAALEAGAGTPAIGAEEELVDGVPDGNGPGPPSHALVNRVIRVHRAPTG